MIINERPIKDDFGSLDEWIREFNLSNKHDIDIDSILRLLDEKGCAKIFREKNKVIFHRQNTKYLETEIRARYDDMFKELHQKK